MGKASRPAPHLVLAAKLPSRLSRTEFLRLFPEKVGEPARPAFKASQASSDNSWSDLLNHPLAEQAVQVLLSGNPVQDSSLAAVIGGHLAAGPIGWAQMGLTHDEAFILYTVYVDVLNCWKRKDVNAHLRLSEPVLVLVKYGHRDHNGPRKSA